MTAADALAKLADLRRKQDEEIAAAHSELLDTLRSAEQRRNDGNAPEARRLLIAAQDIEFDLYCECEVTGALAEAWGPYYEQSESELFGDESC